MHNFSLCNLTCFDLWETDVVRLA